MSERSEIENQVTPETEVLETEIAEAQEAEAEGVEGAETEATETSEGAFGEFAEERAAMIAAGVDIEALDAKLSSGEAFNDEEVALIAEYTKVTPKQVKAWNELKLKTLELTKKANAYTEIEVQKFVSEIDELAGGSHQELVAFIGQAADTGRIERGQIDLWNLALKDPDGNTGLYKTAIKQMAEARKQLSPAPKAGPPKLDLLAQASSNTPKAPTRSPSAGDLLAGNPLANVSVQRLCEIRMNPRHPDYENATKVLSVKAPDLV